MASNPTNPQEHIVENPFGFDVPPPRRTGSNTPLSLNTPDTVWLIMSGIVDIFAVRIAEGRVVGSRHHLFRARAGQALFSMDLSHYAAEIDIIAVGVNNTFVSTIPRQRFDELIHDEQHQSTALDLLDEWVKGLSHSIEGEATLRQYVPLEPAQATNVPAGQVTRPRRGVLWAHVQQGIAHFLGRAELPLFSEDDYIPITADTWLQCNQDSVIYALPTQSFVDQSFSWQILNNFQRMILDCMVWDTLEALEQDIQRLKYRAEFDHERTADSLHRLVSVLEADKSQPVSTTITGDTPLLAACKLIGRALGVRIQARRDPIDGQTEEQSLDAITRASQIRKRRVALKDDWWQHDNGPMLGYLEDGNQSVALLPKSLTSYEMVNPVTGQRIPVDETVAARLSQFAYVFYRTLPTEKLNVWALLRFGFKGAGREIFWVLAMGTIGGLLALFTPLAIGYIFDTVIPAADRTQLFQLALILLIVAVVAVLFQIVRNIAVLRIEIKLDHALQSAVWDRLISLPTPFFRNYTAGDLSNRAMAISAIRRALSGTVVLALLTAIFSIFNFLLLFIVDLRLAIAATILVLVIFIVTIASGYWQMRYRRRQAEEQGRISGMILQFITGISKLRVAAVEHRAFAHWARAFARQRRLAFAAGNMENSLAVFNAFFPLLASIIVFAMVSSADISTGVFLAFNAAFTQFLLAGLQLALAITSILDIVPLYERLKPIIQTEPEVDESKSDPGDLSGEIEVSRLSFRYVADGPLILSDVSFHVNPGEFVALVGPSGSGKSTLLRLLLGFEKPESGGIFYDGQDLSGLDIRLVRHQLGVVLQNSQLMTGDIFTNIIGVAPLTIDDAWEAARMAGLEEDIRNMPMGMHTLLSEGGSTLSGGQRQRLLIARAIAQKPRILFFDEATSALDNRTQAVVSASLERLDATRLVIAHRLSTIINADRIIVLQNGRIVQMGTYDELMRQPGLFADLARRQLI